MHLFGDSFAGLGDGGGGFAKLAHKVRGGLFAMSKTQPPSYLALKHILLFDAN